MDQPDFNEWLNMSNEEQREMLDDKLAEISEVWNGDDADSKFARSMVGAMRLLAQPALEMKNGDAQPNPYVFGVWMNMYVKVMKNFATLQAITDMKKKMGG